MSNSKHIYFTITNAHQLSPRAKVTGAFDETGGSIGSFDADDGKTWYLGNNHPEIAQKHCTIAFLDGTFHVRQGQGDTYVNDSSNPLHREYPAQLNDGDRLRIGPYHIQVNLTAQSQEENSTHLEDYFQQKNPLIDGPKVSDPRKRHAPINQDPLSLLDSENTQDTHDLINGTPPSIADEVHHLLAKDQRFDGHIGTVPADTERDLHSAFIPPSSNTHAGTTHPNKRHDLDKKTGAMQRFSSLFRSHTTNPEVPIMSFKPTESQHPNHQTPSHQHPREHTHHDAADINHLVTGPLIQGLEAPLNDISNTEHMHALSRDIGAALQAAIKGLLALNQQINHSGYGVMNKNLQPIEDNPMRLGLSYSETLQALFDNQRSPVHLSAPAAIRESLNNIDHHNRAVQAAISEALSYILQALSPQTLLHRFKQYRSQPSDNPQDNPQDIASWAWNMYESYYAELMSNRQRGFDKLFWEVFDQVYDKKIREHHQEEPV